MNKGIMVFLGLVVVLGLGSLYALNQGPVLLLRAPSEDRIAFISDREGQTDIWTMRSDGSDARRVTNDAADDQNPTWSPNGKEIMAISDRRNRVYQVFLSAWDGRYTHDLTSSDGTKGAPVFSADGRDVVFINGGKVYTIERTGGTESQLLPLPGSADMAMTGRSSFQYAAWSSTGESLVCVQDTDLGVSSFVVDRDVLEAWQEGELKSTGLVLAQNVNPAWSPTGERLAVSFTGSKSNDGIFVRDFRSMDTVPTFKTTGDTTGPGRVAWSPDGKRLVFELWTLESGRPNRPVGIYVVSAEGGEPVELAKGDTRDPSWSPDGKSIAYTGISKTGVRDIWRVDADGKNATNLTKGVGDCYQAAWSPAVNRK